MRARARIESHKTAHDGSKREGARDERERASAQACTRCAQARMMRPMVLARAQQRKPLCAAAGGASELPG